MKTFDEYMLEAEDQVNRDLKTLVAISDKALDDVYHYGRSEPGSFGYAANEGSVENFLNKYDSGSRDVEELAAAVHEGWGRIAKTYDDPVYAKNPQKRITRLALANKSYEALPDDEKEKDRVIVRALLNHLAEK